MKRIITITFILLIISLPVLAQESGIIFSHKFHAQEVEALCSDCHGKALESVSSVDNLLPAMETCYNCHSEEDTDCTVCHADPDNFGVANRVTGFAANFPHAVHASSDSQCLTCHEGIVKKDKVTDVAMNLPQNTVCQTCHEPVDYAENKAMCVQCHSATMSFKPVTHNGGWRDHHGFVSQMDDQSCRHCHQQSYCLECHEGDNLDHETHPLNYKLTHGLDARANKDNCMTCHQEESACIDCHKTELVWPKNHNFANWSNTTDGGGHARAAKYDLDNCMSCHNDAYGDVVCMTCHQ
jgi:hypothetical protein